MNPIQKCNLYHINIQAGTKSKLKCNKTVFIQEYWLLLKKN